MQWRKHLFLQRVPDANSFSQEWIHLYPSDNFFNWIFYSFSDLYVDFQKIPKSWKKPKRHERIPGAELFFNPASTRKDHVPVSALHLSKTVPSSDRRCRDGLMSKHPWVAQPWNSIDPCTFAHITTRLSSTRDTALLHKQLVRTTWSDRSSRTTLRQQPCTGWPVYLNLWPVVILHRIHIKRVPSPQPSHFQFHFCPCTSSLFQKKKARFFP